MSDDDVALLLAGAADARATTLREHLDSCEMCQELVALAAGDEVETIRDGNTIFGRYHVLGELGRGGMGVVYRVHDPKLLRDLAVKVLHSVDPTAPLRLEREARALARLSHPNIVTVYDIGGQRDQVCMVMELVDGMSLRAWLQERRVPDEVLAVFRQAADGLSAAHAADLVHRDFKPENVLITNDGRVKIVDFGLAAADLLPASPSAIGSSSTIHRLTRTGGAVGTPAYMAPEQLCGAAADARSDQFSFAECVWEALYGTHPFPATTLDDLKRAMAAGPVGGPVRRDAASDALGRALSLEPEARFASIDELVRALTPRRSASSHTLIASVVGAVIVTTAVAVMAFGGGPQRSGAQGSDSATHAASTQASAPLASATSIAPSHVEHDAGETKRLTGANTTGRTAPKSAPPIAPSASGVSTRAPARGPNGAPLIE